MDNTQITYDPGAQLIIKTTTATTVDRISLFSLNIQIEDIGKKIANGQAQVDADQAQMADMIALRDGYMTNAAPLEAPMPTESTDPMPTESTDPMPTESTDPTPTESTDPAPLPDSTTEEVG